MTRERAAELAKEFAGYYARPIFPQPSETEQDHYSIVATLWFTLKELLEDIATGEGP